VAYTKEVAPGVMADYDESGGVRGIEIVEPALAKTADIARLVAVAAAQSDGPKQTKKAG
jgi:uncharacterized protein YuzE